MKKILIIFLFLLSNLIFAQKIKINNDQLIIDKKETGIKVTEEKKETKYVYIFSDNETSEVFAHVDYMFKKTEADTFIQWLEISNDNYDFVNDVDMEYLSSTMSFKKAIAELLMKKYKFFDVDGINEEGIRIFFSEKRSSGNKQKAENPEEDLNENTALYHNLNPFIKEDLTIVKGGRHSNEIIGRLEINYGLKSLIKLYDLDNNLIASSIVQTTSLVKVSLIDDSSFEYKSDYSLNFKDKFLDELLKKIVSKGFVLGHDFANKEKAVQEEINALENKRLEKEFNETLPNTVNIYKKKGYAIDKKGNKIEGLISIFFENIAPKDYEVQTLLSKKALLFTVTYFEENWGDRTKYCNSTGYPYLFVELDDKTTKEFRPLSIENHTKSKRAKYYYEYVKDYGDFEIYRRLDNNFIIKHKDKKSGLFIDEDLLTREEEFFVDIEEYLFSECDMEKISKNADYNILRLIFQNNEIEHIEKLLNFYDICNDKK